MYNIMSRAEGESVNNVVDWRLDLDTALLESVSAPVAGWLYDSCASTV